jgi:hypothetical protein
VQVSRSDLSTEPTHNPKVAGRSCLGNIFQRLDDTATLFGGHADIDVPALVGTDRWERLKRAFAQRHVLVHNGGVVDEKFLNQVPGTFLMLGQRLVVRRADGQTALDDHHSVVRALAEA